MLACALSAQIFHLWLRKKVAIHLREEPDYFREGKRKIDSTCDAVGIWIFPCFYFIPIFWYVLTALSIVDTLILSAESPSLGGWVISAVFIFVSLPQIVIYVFFLLLFFADIFFYIVFACVVVSVVLSATSSVGVSVAQHIISFILFVFAAVMAVCVREVDLFMLRRCFTATPEGIYLGGAGLFKGVMRKCKPVISIAVGKSKAHL